MHESYVHNRVQYEYANEEEAFPSIDPGFSPLGHRVLVQVMLPKKRTKGGLILPNEARDLDRWNTQVGKVIAVAPEAFCDRDSGKQWPGGEWVKPGDYVRVPKYGGDRWTVSIGEGAESDEVMFVLFEDFNILATVTDPLITKAYL